MTKAIDRSTPIERCSPLQTNVHWPVPIDQRLNELVAVLGRHGYDSSRSLLVAALVAASPTEPEQLEQLIRKYRRMKAGTVVLQQRGPIAVPDRKPGRRPRDPTLGKS